MAWRQLLTQVAKQQSKHPYLIDLSGRSRLTLHKVASGGGNGFRNFQGRSQSSYVGNFARRVRDADGTNDGTLLKEIYRSDPERVIRLFESQPSLHSNPAALSEYVKALVQVDKLDGSQLLSTLQRENFRWKNVEVPDQSHLHFLSSYRCNHSSWYSSFICEGFVIYVSLILSAIVR